MKLLLTISISIFALPVIAATSIECGKLDPNEAAVIKSKYEFSSEDDAFNGPVGGTWEMKIGDHWVENSKSITAKTSDSLIVIKKITNQSAKVGKTYIIHTHISDHPTLTIKALGGFAGGTILEEVKCIGFYD